MINRIVVIENVLSRAECEQLMKRAESAGFADSKHQGVRDEGFRRGRRALITDGGLAAEIFARIHRFLPPGAAAPAPTSTPAVEAPAVEAPAVDVPLAGSPVGLWEQLRVLSYDAHDFFLPHRDNPCSPGHSSIMPSFGSLYSILLYLTDSADGSGTTRFYCEEAE